MLYLIVGGVRHGDWFDADPQWLEYGCVNVPDPLPCNALGWDLSPGFTSYTPKLFHIDSDTYITCLVQSAILGADKRYISKLATHAFSLELYQ